jgi:hypothetical protein
MTPRLSSCHLSSFAAPVPQVVSGGAGQAPQAPPVRRTPLQNALYMVPPPGVTIIPPPEPASQAAGAAEGAAEGAPDGSAPAPAPPPAAAVPTDPNYVLRWATFGPTVATVL